MKNLEIQTTEYGNETLDWFPNKEKKIFYLATVHVYFLLLDTSDVISGSWVAW